MRGREFAALRARGRRARRGPITVQFTATGDGQVRVAYAVGRRIGGAVVRNRWRRRLRAIAAQAAPELRDGAYLIGLHADVNDLEFDELREQVITTMRRASGTER